MVKALFLDRDGTINEEVHYLHRPEDFRFVPGIAELCRAAQKAGYIIVVVTNQSGIARGYYTEEDYQRLTAHMRRLFAAQGVELAEVLHCPHLDAAHPDRKPNPGLFLLARDRRGVDMAASLSLGDKERDVLAARRAGVGRNYLLCTDAASASLTQADAIVRSPLDLIALL